MLGSGEEQMPSHTIKVTGVSEELLDLLDQRIRAQHATGRAEYIRELIRRDVLATGDVPPGWPSADMPFRQLLAPVQKEAAQLGETEEETEEFLRQELADYRRKRTDVPPNGAG
jgi:hypothetical protein